MWINKLAPKDFEFLNRISEMLTMSEYALGFRNTLSQWILSVAGGQYIKSTYYGGFSCNHICLISLKRVTKHLTNLLAFQYGVHDFDVDVITLCEHNWQKSRPLISFVSQFSVQRRMKLCWLMELYDAYLSAWKYKQAGGVGATIMKNRIRATHPIPFALIRAVHRLQLKWHWSPMALV